MVLANELLLLRIGAGFQKQESFAAHLGISYRHYQRLETKGLFTRKMLATIRRQYPTFAPSVVS